MPLLYGTRFWQSVPGTEVKNCTELEKNVQALFTFCPLYEQGSLADAGLVQYPQTLENSRVMGKWNGIQKVLEVMSNYIHEKNGSLEITVVFANRGVLLGRAPTERILMPYFIMNSSIEKQSLIFCATHNVPYICTYIGTVYTELYISTINRITI